MPQVRNSIFKALMDDSINIKVSSELVKEVRGPRVRLVHGDIFTDDIVIEPGQKLLFLSGPKKRYLGYAEVVAVERVGYAGADNPWPPRPRLFLVDWLPSQLTLRHPEGLDGVAGSLIDVGKCLDVNLDDVFIGRPTAGEVHRIAYCLAKGDRKDVRKAILASLCGSSQLLGLTQGETDEPVSLLEARARLREALLRPDGKSGERRRRLRQHQEAIDNALVRPLLEQAAAEFDPMRRSQLAALAGVNQMLHPAVELYLAGQEKEVAKRGLRAGGQNPAIQGLMKMFDAASKLCRESE